jgi:hypothetical protein
MFHELGEVEEDLQDLVGDVGGEEGGFEGMYKFVLVLLMQFVPT